MNEVAIQLGGFIGSKAMSAAFDIFKNTVVTRYLNYRANNFFAGIFWSDGEDLNSKLENFSSKLEDPDYSETVFDFYRSACIAKSKTLGPMLLGMIASEILALKTFPNTEQQNLAEFLQEASDDDIRDMDIFLVKDLKRELLANTLKENPNEIIIEWSKDTADLNWNKYELPASPMNLYDCIGKWASLAQRHNLIRVDVIERVSKYRADSGLVGESEVQKELVTQLKLSKTMIDLRENIDKIQIAGLWEQ